MEEELKHIGVVKDDCNGFPWKRIGYVCETDLAVLPIGAKVYGPAVVEALRAQIAKLTKTNLAQAAQIEMMRNELILMKRDKWHWQEDRDRALSITLSQALAAFAAKVRNEAYEKAAVLCDLQQDEPECPERASYCAEAIRNLKELP